MRFKWRALFLAVMHVLLLATCSSGSQNTAEPPASAESTTTTEAAATATAPPAVTRAPSSPLDVIRGEAAPIEMVGALSSICESPDRFAIADTQVRSPAQTTQVLLLPSDETFENAQVLLCGPPPNGLGIFTVSQRAEALAVADADFDGVDDLLFVGEEHEGHIRYLLETAPAPGSGSLDSGLFVSESPELGSGDQPEEWFGCADLSGVGFPSIATGTYVASTGEWQATAIRRMRVEGEMRLSLAESYSGTLAAGWTVVPST